MSLFLRIIATVNFFETMEPTEVGVDYMAVLIDKEPGWRDC